MPYKNKDKQKDYQQKWYIANKTVLKDKLKGNRARNKQIKKEWLIEYKKDKKCYFCDETFPQCLEFHHRDPSIKDETISRLVSGGYSVEKILLEISKCVLVCANCHRKLHYGKLTLNTDVA